MTSRSIFPESSLPPDPKVPGVLLVDGNSHLADKLREPLEQSGCEVHVWRDTEPVIDVIRMIAPDLIIIDVSTTKGSGYELCGEIRATEIGRQVPILLASGGELDEQAVARSLLSGADDVIAADRRPIELQARVRVQLRNKRDRDRLSRLRVERDTYQIQATLDPLTRIPNRRVFESRLKETARANLGFAVLFIDVDHFKNINDRLGHDVGDKVLAAVAECMHRSKRKGDLVARYGGEEFVVLLPTSDRQEAAKQGEVHRAAIEQLSVVGHLTAGEVTVSVGVALSKRDDPDPSSVCQKADEALYLAKRSGRNRVMEAVRMSAVNEPSPLEAYLRAQLATGRAGLPLLPEAAHEALRLAEDPRTDIGRIGRLVDRDPAIAARFIALASSAAYSGRVRPTSTTAALVRIGLQTARDLLLQVVYERVNDRLAMFGNEVWRSFRRSVRSALAARQLAKLIAPSYDLAYLCGLLHDIGEARVYRILATFPEIKQSLGQVEALVETYHERAGAQVAEAWQLPEDIIVACQTHHAGALAHARMPVRIVCGADALTRVWTLVETRGQALLSRPAEGATSAVNALQNADTDLLAQLGVKGPTLAFMIDSLQRALESVDNPSIESSR